MSPRSDRDRVLPHPPTGGAELREARVLWAEPLPDTPFPAPCAPTEEGAGSPGAGEAPAPRGGDAPRPPPASSALCLSGGCQLRVPRPRRGHTPPGRRLGRRGVASRPAMRTRKSGRRNHPRIRTPVTADEVRKQKQTDPSWRPHRLTAQPEMGRDRRRAGGRAAEAPGAAAAPADACDKPTPAPLPASMRDKGSGFPWTLCSDTVTIGCTRMNLLNGLVRTVLVSSSIYNEGTRAHSDEPFPRSVSRWASEPQLRARRSGPGPSLATPHPLPMAGQRLRSGHVQPLPWCVSGTWFISLLW